MYLYNVVELRLTKTALEPDEGFDKCGFVKFNRNLIYVRSKFEAKTF